MGAISSAMKSLFRGSAKAASKEAASSGRSLGKIFIEGVVAQFGGMAAEAATKSLRNKMVESSKAAADMGKASKEASQQTSTALNVAANTAQHAQAKIVNVTNNIYNMRTAYVETSRAAQAANSHLAGNATAAAAQGIQHVANSYRQTTGAIREVDAVVVDSAGKFEKSQQRMRKSGKKTPGIIQKAWKGLKNFKSRLWDEIASISDKASAKVKAGWQSAIKTIDSVSASVKSGLSSLSSALSSAGDWIEGLARKGFWVATAITIGFTAAVTQSSKAEVFMRKFNTVFAESASEVKKWAGAFEKAGLGEFNETIKQLAQFQDTLKPMGMAGKAASELSRQMAALGVDLAAFNGKDNTEAYADLISAVTGSGEVMKKYGVILTETALKEELLSEGLDPKNVTNAEKAYARFQIILKGSGDALGFASKSANEYDGIMRALRGELKGLTIDIGNLLKGGYERMARITLGIVRAVRQFIKGNTELAHSIMEVADWTTVIVHGLEGVAVLFSAAAAGCTVLAGAAGILISPLGMAAVAIAHLTGAADYMKQVYYNAFDGAIAKTVEFALSSRILGVSIRDWFKIGAMAVQMAWAGSLSYIMGKVADFTGVVAGAYESLLQFQVGGLNIGNWIGAGLAIARQYFYELKAVILDTSLVLSIMWVDGKASMLDFWAVVVGKLQSITLGISDIYYEARKTWAKIKALRNPFEGLMDYGKVEAEQKAATEKIKKNLNPQKAKDEADKARNSKSQTHADLQKQLDSSESRSKAEAAKKEAADILAGKKDVADGYIAAEQGITAAVTAEMQKRQEAFAAQAQKIRDDINNIRYSGLAEQAQTATQNIASGIGGIASGLTAPMQGVFQGASTEMSMYVDGLSKGGMDIDKSLMRMKDYIGELGKNNPFTQSFDKIKNLVAAGAQATGKEAKSTAEGSFKAGELAGGEKTDPLQDRIAQAVEQTAKTNRDISSGILDLNDKFSVAR